SRSLARPPPRRGRSCRASRPRSRRSSCHIALSCFVSLNDGRGRKDVTVDGDRQAREFEQHRAHLQAGAYRMLGSLSEAEDAVQESWFRLKRSETSQVENMRGWLTTVVARVCLDLLRARRARREDLVGGELPEPIVTLPSDGPEDEALLADSVGLALL